MPSSPTVADRPAQPRSTATWPTRTSADGGRARPGGRPRPAHLRCASNGPGRDGRRDQPAVGPPPRRSPATSDANGNCGSSEVKSGRAERPRSPTSGSASNRRHSADSSLASVAAERRRPTGCCRASSTGPWRRSRWSAPASRGAPSRAAGSSGGARPSTRRRSPSPQERAYASRSSLPIERSATPPPRSMSGCASPTEMTVHSAAFGSLARQARSPRRWPGTRSAGSPVARRPRSSSSAARRATPSPRGAPEAGAARRRTRART